VTKKLSAKRVVIGASRKTEEISMLIEKQGGVPIIRSLQGTVFLAKKELGVDLQHVISAGVDWAIFTTGIGVETLLTTTEKLGIQTEFFRMLHQANVATRGCKTLSTLKKMDINPVATDEDGTTQSLLHSLENFDFKEKKVMVQLHGEKAPRLIKFLEDRGAHVFKVLPYQHISPNSEIVKKLCNELMNNEIDAVCFTTAIQVRSLFDFAKEHSYLREVQHAFKEQVVAVAVGKVTAEALNEEGIQRIIVPERERMGAMIIELSRFYAN